MRLDMFNFVADGFCNFESTDSPEGSIQWPESINGTIVNIPCPFGPTNAQASRTCVSHLNWSSPNVSECATNATIGFQALDLGISEVCYSSVEGMNLRRYTMSF